MSQWYRRANSLLVSLMLVAAIVLPFAFGSAMAIDKSLPALTATTEATKMTPEVARSLIERAANGWIKGDAKAFATLFTPDGEFVVPGQRLVGASAIEKTAAEFAKSNAQVTIKIHRIILDGQQAVVEWQWEDTENSTGKHTRADDAIVVDFADGKIKRWREYIDTKTPQVS